MYKTFIVKAHGLQEHRTTLGSTFVSREREAKVAVGADSQKLDIAWSYESHCLLKHTDDEADWIHALGAKF